MGVCDEEGTALSIAREVFAFCVPRAHERQILRTQRTGTPRSKAKERLRGAFGSDLPKVPWLVRTAMGQESLVLSQSFWRQLEGWRRLGSQW